MGKQSVSAPPPNRPEESDESIALRRCVRCLMTLASQKSRDPLRNIESPNPLQDKRDTTRALEIFSRTRFRSLQLVWTRYDSHALEDFMGRNGTDLTYFEGAILAVLELCGDDWALGFYRGRVGMFPWNHANETQFVRAVQDFSAAHTDEISFSKGALIPVKRTVSPDRLIGFHDMEYGLFPAKCVVPMKGTLLDVVTAESQDQYFSYRQLAYNEIRLIKITRTQLQHFSNCGRSTIFLTLETVSASAAPPYKALSYCWGDSELTETIFCNEKLLNIPKNLARALRWEIPDKQTGDTGDNSEWTDVYLWADAICINQKDVMEKNFQVTLMKHIYERADKVILFVNESEHSFDLLNSISSVHRLRKEAPPWVVANHEVTTKSMSQIDWDTLRDFAKEPAFRRSWIMQELVLGRQVVVWYGSAEIELSILYGTIEIIQSRALRPSQSRLATFVRDQVEKQAYNDGMTQLYNLAVIKAAHVKNDPKDFIEILRRFRSTRANDLRDKVYSVLSLAHEGYQRALSPDYSPSNTTAMVYQQLARYAATNPEVTGLLQAAGTSQMIEGLPSWVPDWSIEARVSIPPSFYHCAGDSTVSVRSPSHDPDQLTVRGAIVDAVLLTNKPWPKTDDFLRTWQLEDSRYDGGQHGEHVFGIVVHDALMLNLVAIAHAIGLTDATPEKLSPMVWQTLVCGRGWGERRTIPEDKRHYDAYIEYYGGFMQKDHESGKYRAADLVKTRSAAEKAKLEDEQFPFFNIMANYQPGRRTCITKRARTATVPDEAQVGDLIAIFAGFAMPFVIRKVDRPDHNRPGDNSPTYKLIGHCYVYGIMDGELMVNEEMTETKPPATTPTRSNTDVTPTKKQDEQQQQQHLLFPPLPGYLQQEDRENKTLSHDRDPAEKPSLDHSSPMADTSQLPAAEPTTTAPVLDLKDNENKKVNDNGGGDDDEMDRLASAVDRNTIKDDYGSGSRPSEKPVKDLKVKGAETIDIILV